ncbi:alpha/beta fold hydrolase, partial [Actinomadura adrarensis]
MSAGLLDRPGHALHALTIALPDPSGNSYDRRRPNGVRSVGGMRHADWGVVSPRWAGVRSREIDVCGTSVHYLTAGEERAGPEQLVVHPMAGSASMMLDVIASVSKLGPVVAPDLPGTMFGHTASPHPRAPKAEPNARFLRAFTARLG